MLANAASERLQQAKQQMYRTHILDVAEEVLAEHGYEGAQVKLVARRARISLSTLYGYFDNKMTLYRAIHARRLQLLMAELAALEQQDAQPLEQMLAAIGVYIAYHMKHPNYLRMHLREGTNWSCADGLLSPEQLASWRQGQQQMAGTFKAGMQSGVFVRVDPLLAARTTNASHPVALAQWVTEGMVMAPDQLIERLRAQFIRAFCAPARIVDLLAEHVPGER